MKSKSFFILLIISFIVSLLILKYSFSKKVNFSEFALGEQTVTYFAQDSLNNNIHISSIDSVAYQNINSFKSIEPDKEVLLILGNSQSHTINQKNHNEVNYIELLSRQIKDYKVFATTFPNASMQDFYITYSYLKLKFNLNAILIPVFLDDMRENNGITYEFYPQLVLEKFIIPNNNNNLLTHKLNNSFSNLIDINLKKSINLQTLQEKSEDYLNEFLTKRTNTWENREYANGYLLGQLFELRNLIFNVKATTIRKMLPDRYLNNMNALNLIISDAIKNNIQIFLYTPPIRHDFQIPYDLNEYEKLKNTLKNITDKNPNFIKYKDFDTIIASNFFGYKLSSNFLKQKLETDFMHFQYKGHQILSDSLRAYLNTNSIK
jgi:hypothetical protein